MKIMHFDSLESTNIFLQNLIDEGLDVADNVVVTDFQTAGKGQGRNVWESENGKNLLFSIALDMSFLKAENQFSLTQMVSVAMINVLKKYISPNSLHIKWPNDIYFNDKKIAGILIKNEIKGCYLGTSIIGIGLNVNQISFGENLPNPISMKMISGEYYNLNYLLLQICEELASLRNCLKESSVDAAQEEQSATIKNLYIKHHYRYKQWALYEYDNQLKEMMIVDFDIYGRLVLRDRNDLEYVCDLKEIKYKL